MTRVVNFIAQTTTTISEASCQRKRTPIDLQKIFLLHVRKTRKGLDDLKNMARNEQLIRQHKVLQILERVRFGRTLDELKEDLIEELGLSSLNQRTVRRDLEALQAAGFDVDVHDSQTGKDLETWSTSKASSQDHGISNGTDRTFVGSRLALSARGNSILDWRRNVLEQNAGRTT